MSKQIVIEPVTRIEGHGKITITLDEQGAVNDAQFHVTQFRGFEKFCEGRPYYEMPSLVERICGICPISHSVASAKACDAILGIRVPETAAMLRRLLFCAQMLQSHALSFFHLCAPDLLAGMDAPPEKRNILGIMESNPSIAMDGIRLRSIGQQIIQGFAGKRIHPAWVVPGGVNEPLSQENRDVMIPMVQEALGLILKTLTWFKNSIEDHREEIASFANFPSLFMALVNEEGNLEHLDGVLRFIDYKGNTVAELEDMARYQEYVGEAVEEFSFLKSPYYKPWGYPDGIYRVGPAARLNVCNGCGTPLADQEWAEFRSLERGPILSSFHNHYARLIEMLFAVETLQKLLNDPEILSTHVRAFAQPNYQEGIGVVEAPRGTLFHHYQVDELGLMSRANMIVATGNNNLAMNRGILQAAKRFINGDTISEGALNRIEAVIRAFDPCLSCSTHVIGRRAFPVELRDSEGKLLDQTDMDRQG